MIKKLLRFFRKPKVVEAQKEQGPAGRIGISSMALAKAARKTAEIQEFVPYIPPAGVIPDEKRTQALAMDATPYDYVNGAYVNNFWPGYQYLAMLAQLPEYRKLSEIRAKYMVRKWIAFRSKSDGDKTDKIGKIQDEFTRLGVKALFQKAAELDGLFGRAQIYLDVKMPGGKIASADDAELATPLIVDPRKIEKGALVSLRIIEPIWTYPSSYNTTKPLEANYYKPMTWFVMGQTVHDSRLLLFVSRPMPDLLKAAYNFGGLSMSQMAQPYVQNWLRTRDSVSDLVHSFSVSGIKTDLAATLAGTDSTQFENRAALFNGGRDNRGLMMLNKDTEEFFQFNTPLGGVDSLQAQSQEQMSSVASIPLIVLLGITPTGLNASSEGELKVFNDSINSDQETLFRPPLQRVLEITQLSLFGEIDPDIVFDFEPLYSLNDKEKAEVRKTEADADAVYVSIGAVSPDEVRAKLAADPDSGFDGLEAEIQDGDDPELDSRHMDLTVKSKINDE